MEVVEKRDGEISPPKVEVPVWARILPLTANKAPGPDVAMPIFPPFSMVRRGAAAELV